jgi:sialate O-acetylesterase
MVLQQKSDAPIWGWSWPGSEVILKASWDNEEIKVRASNAGAWKTSIKTPDAGGPYSLTITSGDVIELKDVLIGEVWICSGQSNMEWSMNGANDGKEELPNANLANVRMFQAKKIATDFPQVKIEGEWKTTTPENAQAFSAVGYFFGKKLNHELNIPIGLINVSWGGTPADTWIPENLVLENSELKAANEKLPEHAYWPKKPGAVFNAMIYPLQPMQIAGVIWYQGEGNTAAPLSYKNMMEQLIQSWRKGFNKEFPFYYVQIAPFTYGEIDQGTLIREQQVKMLEIPKTGMVVISDHVEDVKDIHPRFKLPVGERLADYALAETYGKSIPHKSPLYKSMKIEKNKIRITFENAPNGLISKGGEPTEFLIAGEDQNFVPAKAKIDGSSVVVSSREIKSPVAVRFGWPNASVPNLFSKEGLPVSCFRTDDWPVLE